MKIQSNRLDRRDDGPFIRARLLDIAALAVAALEAMDDAEGITVMGWVGEVRREQNRRWGGRLHDQQHTPEEWTQLINKQVRQLQAHHRAHPTFPAPSAGGQEVGG